MRKLPIYLETPANDLNAMKHKTYSIKPYRRAWEEPASRPVHPRNAAVLRRTSRTYFAFAVNIWTSTINR